MPRYTQEDRDKALGALMASAVDVGGGGTWVPNFRAVYARLKISPRTLERWWEARDRSQDAELRRSVSRAREDLAEEGAGQFLRDLTGGLVRIARYIINPIHYATDLVKVEGEDDLMRVRGLRPDLAAKALLGLVGIHKELGGLLSGTEGGDKTDPLAHARVAAQRTRLVATMDQAQTSTPSPDPDPPPGEDP